MKDTFGIKEERHRAMHLKLLRMSSVQGLVLGLTSRDADSGCWDGGVVSLEIFILSKL